MKPPTAQATVDDQRAKHIIQEERLLRTIRGEDRQQQERTVPQIETTVEARNTVGKDDQRRHPIAGPRTRPASAPDTAAPEAVDMRIAEAAPPQGGAEKGNPDEHDRDDDP